MVCAHVLFFLDATISVHLINYIAHPCIMQADTFSDCSNSSNATSPLCASNLGIGSLLGLHTLGDYDQFCLAYLLTYRQFTEGILGLAFVAYPNGKFLAAIIFSRVLR